MTKQYSALVHAVARMDEERASWRRGLAQFDTKAKQMQELSQPNLGYAQIAKELSVLHSPAVAFVQRYQDLLGVNSSAMQAVRAFQEAGLAQHEHIQRMLAPMENIRNSLLVNNTAQQLIKELTEAGSIRDHLKEIADQFAGVGSIAKMLAQQADESQTQYRRLFDSFSVASSIQNYLKDFEHINKRWIVPTEVLGIIGSFKEIQEQVGRVALPTIDWGSAGALATVLGQDGIREQLALLGIGPDGSILPTTETPEKGILSRKQSDAAALVSLLLSILFFIYQEHSSQQDKAKTEEFQAQTAATLQAQAQQIHSLTVLIGRALEQAAQEQEERFVVRKRPATVRSKPEHGAAIEGKLLPNEVVRTIDRKGRWVKVEYYHWLHEEYRTGWVLKHYLERVPANHSKNAQK